MREPAILSRFKIKLNQKQLKSLSKFFKGYSGHAMIAIEPRVIEQTLRCLIISNKLGAKLRAIIIKEAGGSIDWNTL